MSDVKRTKLHMCVDVRGVLTNWTRPHQYRGFFKHDDGREMTMAEARAELLEALSRGRERLPVGDCDTFDYKTGCPGHPMPDDPRP